MSLSEMHPEFTCINNKERDQDKEEWVGFYNHLPINLTKSRKDQMIFSKGIFSSVPNYLVSKKIKTAGTLLVLGTHSKDRMKALGFRRLFVLILRSILHIITGDSEDAKLLQFLTQKTYEISLCCS